MKLTNKLKNYNSKEIENYNKGLCVFCGERKRRILYCSKVCGMKRNHKKNKDKRLERKTKKLRHDSVKTSDLVEFGNYKEPLIRFKGGKIGGKKFKIGFGYKGVLAYSKLRDKVQCSLCGCMFRSITESHLISCHGISHKQYKELVGLSSTTALCGEGTREKLINNYRKNKAALAAAERNKFLRMKNIEKLIKYNRSRKGQRIRLESRNKRGTCPEQLLDKIRKLKEKLKHVPAKKDFYMEHSGKYLGIIYEIFGSWTKAVRMAGYKPVSEVRKEKYSNKKLLQYLRIFFKKKKRTPSHSDFSRGLLPSDNIYCRRFGGLNNARKLAGVPIIINLGRGGAIEKMI